MIIEDLKTKYGIPYSIEIMGVVHDEGVERWRESIFTVIVLTDLSPHTEEVDVECVPMYSFENDFDDHVNNFVEAHREKWEKETDRRVMKAMYEMVADITIDNEEVDFIDLSFHKTDPTNIALIYIINNNLEKSVLAHDYDDVVFHLEKLAKKDISEYYRE